MSWRVREGRGAEPSGDAAAPPVGVCGTVAAERGRCEPLAPGAVEFVLDWMAAAETKGEKRSEAKRSDDR